MLKLDPRHCYRSHEARADLRKISAVFQCIWFRWGLCIFQVGGGHYFLARKNGPLQIRECRRIWGFKILKNSYSDIFILLCKLRTRVKHILQNSSTKGSREIYTLIHLSHWMSTPLEEFWFHILLACPKDGHNRPLWPYVPSGSWKSGSQAGAYHSRKTEKLWMGYCSISYGPQLKYKSSENV